MRNKISIGTVDEVLKNPGNYEEETYLKFNTGALRNKKQPKTETVSKPSYKNYSDVKPVRNGKSGPSLFMALIIGVAAFSVFTVFVSKVTGNSFSFDKLVPNFSADKTLIPTAPKEVISKAMLPQNIDAESDNVKEMRKAFKIDEDGNSVSVKKSAATLPPMGKTETADYTDNDKYVKQYQMNYDSWKSESGAKDTATKTTSAKIGANTVVTQTIVRDENGNEKSYISRDQIGSENTHKVFVEEKLAKKNTMNSNGVLTNDLSYYANNK